MRRKVIFSTESVEKIFGGIRAIHAITFQIYKGEIQGLIGPNGAGKTTLVNLMTGVEKPSMGKMFFLNKRIDDISSKTIFQMGISRTFQEGRIVPGLTVLENIISGLPSLEKNNFFRLTSNLILKSRINDQIMIKGKEILEAFDLVSLSERWAEDLVWAERQLVQIARAVISKPKLLLLDEPTAGMGQKEKEKIGRQIERINRKGITILLVSHDVQFVRHLAQRITVLDFGQKISQGTPEKVFNDSRVWEAYLGEQSSTYFKN